VRFGRMSRLGQDRGLRLFAFSTALHQRGAGRDSGRIHCLVLTGRPRPGEPAADCQARSLQIRAKARGVGQCAAERCRVTDRDHQGIPSRLQVFEEHRQVRYHHGKAGAHGFCSQLRALTGQASRPDATPTTEPASELVSS
jgi:hypothetical protein